MRRLGPPHQRIDLNVEGLIAIGIERLRIVGHKGEAPCWTDQADIGVFAGVLEHHAAESVFRPPVSLGGIGKGLIAHPLARDPIGVDIDHAQLWIEIKTGAFRKQAAKFYEGWTVKFVSDQAEYEAALEAMANKVAVISSNTGGIPEVNKHGVSGFLSNVGDVDDMAKNAIYLLSDDKRLEEFKVNAQGISREFEIKNILPLYEDVYAKAYNSRFKNSY